MTKHHRLGGLHSRHLLPHSSGDWKSEVKMLAGLVSSEASLLGWSMASFSCVLTWSAPFVCICVLTPICFIIITFYWSMIALQCCIGFCCTTKWINFKYTYIHSLLNLSPTPLGHHRARSWAPCCVAQRPTRYFTHGLSCFSWVQLFATLWTVACQAPMFMWFSRQQYWSGLSCPPPRDLSNPGIEPTSPEAPTLQVECLPLSHLGSPTTRKCLSIYFSTSPSGSSLRKVRVVLVPAWSAHNKHSMCSDESFCFLNKLHMKEWMPCSYGEFTK